MNSLMMQIIDPKPIPAQCEELIQGKGTATFEIMKNILMLARFKARDLPLPLPWIEPSLNMPHLQACLAYLLGAPLGSILTMCALLEHALRLAAIDWLEGYQGAMKEALWVRYSSFSVGDFLKGARGNAKPEPQLLAAVGTIIPSEDVDWWLHAARHIRNRVTHLDYPEMLSDLGRDEVYMGLYAIPDDQRLAFRTRSRWGFVFHRFDDSVAATFLKESTEKIKNVIDMMKWQPDLSGWVSQKGEYDSFFAFDWSRVGQ
jgi:hypothetical protein